MKRLKFLITLFILLFSFACTKEPANNKKDIKVDMIEELAFFDTVAVFAQTSETPVNAKVGFVIEEGIKALDELKSSSNIEYSLYSNSDNQYFFDLDNFSYDKEYSVTSFIETNDEKTFASSVFTFNIYNYVLDLKNSESYTKNSLVESIYNSYLGSLKVHLIYDLDGGTLTNPVEEVTLNESQSLKAPSKDGYKFKGYLFSNDNQIRLSYPGFTEIIDTITLKAIWEELTYVQTIQDLNFYQEVELIGHVNVMAKNMAFGFVIEEGEKTLDEMMESTNYLYALYTDNDKNYQVALTSIDYSLSYTVLAFSKIGDEFYYAKDTYTFNVYDYVIDKVSSSDYQTNILIDEIYMEYINSLKVKLNYELDGGELKYDLYEVFLTKPTSLPKAVKENYIFKGYLFSIDNEIHQNYPGYNEVFDTLTLTAVWEEITSAKVTVDYILDLLPDLVDANDTITFPSDFEGTKVKWESSKPREFVITDNKCTIRYDQLTHNYQTINFTVEITYADNTVADGSKAIRVKPITFDPLPSTPFGTYFQTSAAAIFRQQNPHYLENKTYFSEKALNTINILYYAFITPSSYATVSLSDISMAKELVKLRASGIRVIGSIAGVSGETSKYFANITSDPDLLSKFVKNLMDLVEQYHFDGLDIDWESTSEQYVVASGMNNLAKALREEMDRRTSEDSVPYMLTAAVPASSWGLGSDRYDFKTLNNYLDYLNIMSYDANKSTTTTHVDPFYISSYDNGYGFGFMYGINQLTALGFPKSKLMGGLAGYGKAYKISDSINMGAKYPGLGVSAKLTKVGNLLGSYDSGTLFVGAIDELKNNPKYVKYTEYNRNNQLVACYLLNQEEGIFVTYEDVDVVREKYLYCDQTEGLGVMCWAYTEDTKGFIVDTIAELRGNE